MTSGSALETSVATLPPAPRRSVVRWVPVEAVVGVAVALAVLGPVLLRRGYVLAYDLVVVPDPPLAARLLGADGVAPRAAPSDLVVALLARLMPADVVEKLLLVAIVGLAAAGAARLARRTFGTGTGGAVVAGLVYAWSPFLSERLVLGQWALLLGVAGVPWAVGASVRARSGDLPALATACAWTIPAAVGGANAVALTAPVVLAVLLTVGQDADLAARLRAAAAYAAFTAVVSLPWALPALLRSGGLPSDPAGVGAFAAAADGPLGVAGSLVTLGGIWNAAVVPPERASAVLAVLALVAVAGALGAGLPGVLRRPGGPGLTVGGVLAFGLAAVGATPPGGAVLRWAVVAVPGGGLLRDGQKFLAGWVLLVAVAGGVAAERGAALLRRSGAGPLALVAAALLPVALTPSLAWGASGRLQPVDYPPDWGRVRAVLDADPAPGAVVVLPWGAYRRFGWNGLRVALDPAQRISGRPVVQDDALSLRSGTVAGEDPRARVVRATLATPGPLAPRLAGLGYRYVLIHAGDRDAAAVRSRLGRTDCVVCGSDLELRRLVPAADHLPAVPAGTPAGPGRAALFAGLAAAGVAAGLAAAAAIVGAAARRRRRPPPSGSRSLPADDSDC